MNHITIMQGETPSTKHYTINAETDACEKGEVAQAYLHDSHTIPVDNLADLYEVIQYAREDATRYVIRGMGIEEHQFKVRRTKLSEDQQDGNFYEMPTSWICCDFDKYIVPDDIGRTSIEAIEWLIKNELPAEFHDVSYIYQWSASAGLVYNNKPVKTGTNVHLFFYLDRALLDTELQTWFHKEIENGFDGSTFRTVTPIFVNSFVEKDNRIIDIIPDQDKFGIIAKDKIEVNVPTITPIVKQHQSSYVPDTDLANEIMQYLQQIGAIYGRRSGWILLKHPREKTSGDWHLKSHTPQVIHHHVQKSMRIDKWIKEFYGIEQHFNFKKIDTILSPQAAIIKLNKKVRIY